MAAIDGRCRSASDAGMTEEELAALLRRTLPTCDLHDLTVEAIEEGEIRLHFPFKPDHVGPGGIVSGPLLLSHVDTAIYAAV
ncbi:MAG: PaaI family thioesterase, partial [Xanthobacteraceae bacterium]